MEINKILTEISGFIWGSGLIFLLLSVGFIYTVKLKFIQFRFIPYLIKNIKSSSCIKKSGGISQLKTICLSLGTAMGTGNITGVASALAIGGPGAIFWMWVSAFFGMALVYSENYLAIVFRKPGVCTGPMAYLSYGLGSGILAGIFALFCLLASLGMGGMVQVSSFSESFNECFCINKYLLAAAVFVLIYAVIKGGVGRIGSAAQALLPAVTIAYAAVSFAVLFRFRERIIPAFGEIFSGAFSFTSAAGGVSGFAVSKAVSAGVRRGIFSNEAGLGSSPILHCAAESGSPSLQGMCSIFEVFFDTMICCTLTALVILTSCSSGNYSVSHAFSSVLGRGSGYFLSASMAVFAFCTIIGWYYCGETAFTYLFGNRHIKTFCIAFAAAASLGAVIRLETVWTLSDIFNGLMAFPNLLGLILLINKVRKE